PSVSRGTVYRNLQKLVDGGEALQLQLTERGARYDGRTDDHDHFVCSDCGFVTDVEQNPSLTTRRVPGAKGLRVQRVAVTYFGRCWQCSASGEERPRKKPPRVA